MRTLSRVPVNAQLASHAGRRDFQPKRFSRRIFKSTNRLYSENTATVDFVARIFLSFQLSLFSF
jgi:hypothetical protein